MKNLIIAIMLVMATTFAAHSQLNYQCAGYPDTQVTVVSGGIMINIDGSSTPLFLYPQGFLSCYMYYVGDGVNALFTTDLSSMLLYVGGQTYQYTLTITPAGSTPGFNYPQQPVPNYVPNYGPSYVPDYGPSEADRSYYMSEIRALRYKIRDAERSLRRYERSNERDPSISSMQLVISQRRLINTYRERLRWLESQLY